MSEPQAADDRISWKKVQSWGTQEKFWQDVTTRTISGIVVLLVVFFYGAFSGWIPVRDQLFHAWRALFIAGVLAIVLLPFVAALIISWFALRRWRQGNGGRLPMMFAVVFVLLLFSEVMLACLAIYYDSLIDDNLVRIERLLRD